MGLVDGHNLGSRVGKKRENGTFGKGRAVMHVRICLICMYPRTHMPRHKELETPMLSWSIRYVYVDCASLQTLGGKGAALTIFVILTEAIF